MGENGDSSLTVLPLSRAELSGVDLPGWARERHIKAAWALSFGVGYAEAARFAGVSERSISRWVNDPERGTEFNGLVNIFTFRSGLADRGERLREVKRLYSEIKADTKKALKKHDGVDLLRLAAELSGDFGGVPGHPVLMYVQNLFTGPSGLNLPCGQWRGGRVARR